ncbi:MAG: hypothetical protein WC661_04685 [Opitutaceae bacterium]|jgi:hypothetical protein
MKTRLWILPLLLLSSQSLPAVEPADFTVMLRGYCYAGNAQNDPKAIGGYGKCDNLPKPLASPATTKDLHLEIADAKDAVFAQKYAAILVRLVNGQNKTAEISASDSRLGIVQEALDTDGTWKEIEYLPNSGCGNSYHHVYLAPNHYWEFVAPKYSGPQKTKLRFKLTISPNQILYSPPYAGGIHPEQLTVKQGHNPTNLMDPYGN